MIKFETVVELDGPALVVADLHLRARRDADDDYVFGWIANQIASHSVSSIVFAGDTFELSFLEEPGRSFREELESIIEVHSDLWHALLGHSQIEEAVFLVGDHDFRLPGLVDVVADSLGGLGRIRAGEIALHAESKAMILHGHQFDMNRTPGSLIGSPLTERLGDAFEKLVYDGSGRQFAFDDACDRGVFSFWYGEGKLRDYLSLLEACFGYDTIGFWQACSAHLARGTHWLPTVLTEKLSYSRSVQKACSLSPRMMFLGHCVRFLLLGRCPGVQNMIDGGGLSRWKYLVAGHLHRPVVLRGARRTAVFVVASPRLHVGGRWKDHLLLQRSAAAVVLSGDGVRYEKAMQESTSLSIEEVLTPCTLAGVPRLRKGRLNKRGELA